MATYATIYFKLNGYEQHIDMMCWHTDTSETLKKELLRAFPKAEFIRAEFKTATTIDNSAF